MKTLKLILLALLMMAGFAANAQTIQIYKNGVVVKEYDAAAVDSVIYKPAEAQPRYYYYAGWECPTTEAELASKGTLIGTTLGTYTKSNPLKDYTKTPIIGPEDMNDEDYYYVVIPNSLSVYDSLGNDVTTTAFNKQTSNISNYNVYKSKQTQWDIDAIVIY